MGKWREAALRYGLLFLIAMFLVAGFWFHAAFYDLGLGPLLLVGSLAVVLVVAAVRLAFSRRPLGARGAAEIQIDPGTGERLRTGGATLLIRPVTSTTPPPGSLARAVYPHGGTAGHVRVRRTYRRLAADLTEREATEAGHRGLAAFIEREKGAGRWNPEDVLTLVHLEPVGD